MIQAFFTFIMVAALVFMSTDALVSAKIAERQVRVNHYASIAIDAAKAQLLNSLRQNISSGSYDPNSASAPPMPTYAAPNLCPGQYTCGVTAAASYTVTGCTNGYSSPAAGTTATAYNLNTTLHQAICSIAMTVTVTRTSDGSTLSTRRVRASYSLLQPSPYAVMVGSSDSLAGASANLTATQDSNTSGCDPSNPASCGTVTDQTLNSPSLYHDTRVHVAPTCAPNEDPTECSNTTNRPSDNFQNGSWGVQH